MLSKTPRRVSNEQEEMTVFTTDSVENTKQKQTTRKKGLDLGTQLEKLNMSFAHFGENDLDKLTDSPQRPVKRTISGVSSGSTRRGGKRNECN